ncbi:hypothetical protein MFLAVUS_004710 [Mucor flavus]|uniref:Uncharacterized protein n=1 Tax=Mucor flavus TaxID=439312 RepID=A0ABP9YWR3_9FUNG
MGYGDNIRLYFDLVTTNLYDIEVVLLEVVHWGRSVNDSIIDLTCFKKLKTFIYSAGDIEDDDQNYADNQENDFSQAEYGKNLTTPCPTLFCDASVSSGFRQDATFEEYRDIALLNSK